MKNVEVLVPLCRLHGKPTKRGSCKECNAAYMREYLRRRRGEMPRASLWERAKKRAKSKGLPFTISKDDLDIPRRCPVLGVPIEVGRSRSDSSPSLDKVVPELGYTPDNVRVISDRANRLKGRRSLGELRRLASSGPAQFRADYQLVADYVERESLLRRVKQKAARSGRAGEEWAKVANFLDRIIRNGVTRIGMGARSCR